MLPTLRRSAVVLAGTAAILVAASAPALAHVEVEAQPSRALATNASLRLTAEAESATAGTAAVRVQLPAGLIPTDFRLLSGPPGWRLRGSGQVLDVRGRALPVGRDLELVMRVRQLPAARLVVLKTVQTYGDGHEDAWIEVQPAGAPEPDHPAPVLRLAAPAAAGATPLPRATSAPASPSSATPTPTPAPTPAPTSTPASAGSPSTGDDSGVGWILGGVGIGFLLLGAALLALRRRSRAP